METTMRISKLSWGLALAGATFLANAQEYPAKPVRLVDPFPPGAITSNVSRLIAQKFQEQTGQPMIVDHKPGGGTNLGGALVAQAAPDGYTLLLGTITMAVNQSLYRSMPYDPIKDLTPIIQLVRTPNVLAVSNKLPVRNVQELIAYARANPGKLNYASSGNGASNHLGMELFKSMANVDIVHVPFKGGAEASTALLAGQVQLMLSPESTVGGHHKAGTLRVIASGGDRRLATLDVPPVSESGLPGFESSTWLALFAPAGTPAAVVARVNREATRALKDPKVAEVLQTAGLTPMGGTPEEMRKILADDTARMASVVKASGARVD